MPELPPQPAKPAATVIIFRNGAPGKPPQILMVQRANEMRFAGGAAVFPGGRVDEADTELAARLAPDELPAVAAARVAGVRETLEETGLAIALERAVSGSEVADARAFLLEQGALAPVLERFGWNLVLDRLTPFARWCPNWQGAFDTRFFLADLGTGAVDITIDATENTRLFWASASEAIAMAASGEISVLFPTLRNLERIAQFISFDEARSHAEALPVKLIVPERREADGVTLLTIPEGLGYPVTQQDITTIRRG